MKMFKVTKKFTSGILSGLTVTELTSVAFEVGFECKAPCGGSPYVIISVEEVCE